MPFCCSGILQSEEAVQYLSKIKLEEGPNAKNNYLACYVSTVSVCIDNVIVHGLGQRSCILSFIFSS